MIGVEQRGGSDVSSADGDIVDSLGMQDAHEQLGGVVYSACLETELARLQLSGLAHAERQLTIVFETATVAMWTNTNEASQRIEMIRLRLSQFQNST